MREYEIERTVVDFAESRGWLVRKVLYAGRRGAPDRWFFKGGQLILVEFKRPGRKPDGQQQREHDRLRGAGFPVYIIDSVEGGVGLFA